MRPCQPLSAAVGPVAGLVVGLVAGLVVGLLGSLAPAGVAAAPATAKAAVAAPVTRMPSEVPSTRTPWVLDGAVAKIVQVGDVMVAGGEFTRVADPMDGKVVTRHNLVAFDATTGLVSRTFLPRLDGAVQQLLPGPTDHTVYVAGDFTRVNGRGPDHLQLLDVRTGRAVRGFRAPRTNAGIQTMALLPGNRLFIGGFFTRIGGAPHGQLATLDATTGALTPFLDLKVAGHHNSTGSGARASVGPREAGVTPAGDRLVVVGNFRWAGGLPRDQIAMIDLTGRRARISTTWATTQYTPLCSPRSFDSYMRDVEMAPDGSFFVVATTGGPHPGSLCDTAARFETYTSGTRQTPTWTAASGGDTLWGVEITGAAVYVGGHQRWMNNPHGTNRAAQGAVPRPGLAALDPESGIPLRWNPGRNPRGEAAYEIHETDSGIWVVSNTDWIGNRRFHRPRVAFFPYSDGTDTAPKNTGALPGDVYVGAPLASAPDTSTAAVIGFDGSTVTSRNEVSTGAFDWTTVRGAVMIGRTLFYGQTDGFLHRRSFDGTDFGGPTKVNPYLDPLWSRVPTGSGPRGQTYAGALPAWYAQLRSVTGMFYDRGRIYYTRSGRDALSWRWFSPDSGIVGGIEHTAPGGNIRWSTTRGLFLDGTTLYVVRASDGRLLRTTFTDGAPRGTSSVADATTDWRGRAVFLASVDTNLAPSAAFTASCTGTTCTFDATGSSDGDGTVADWAWDFGDGVTGTGVTVDHRYARPGRLQVRLVVTDDRGATAEVVVPLDVVGDSDGAGGGRDPRAVPHLR